MSYTYANRFRTGLSLLAPNVSAWTQSYRYDSAKRLTNVASPAGSFSYALAGSSPASSLPRKLTLPNGAYITNTYDNVARMLSTSLKNSANSILDSHSYQLNAGNQRIEHVFTAGNYVDYAYDGAGQLKTAFGKESGGTTNRIHEQLGYAYDGAGNLNWRTNNALLQRFNVNALNELTTVSRSGTMTVVGTTTGSATNVTVNTSNAILFADYTFVSSNHTLADGNNTFTAIAKDTYGRSDTNSSISYLPSTNLFAYDLNGNLPTNGTRFFEYDDENQLIRITEPSAWRLEFSYDGKLRRRVRKEFTWRNGSWLETNEVRYIHDGPLVVQERDANNLATARYTRGQDLSGTLVGAGGMGGLLSRTDHSALLATGSPFSAHAYYFGDGNANIAALLDTNQIIVARYSYDPFGRGVLVSGRVAEANLYRFSSKEIIAAYEGYYYLYRFYDPGLQRWPNRDPLEESGGINLFLFVGNSSVSSVDPSGLLSTPSSTITPWELGWEWLTGDNPKHREFKDGDYFAELLRKRSHIRKLVAEASSEAASRCANGCNNKGFEFTGARANYDLSGVQGVGKYLGDYSTLLTGGLASNLAVTFLGSYSAKVSTTGISCCAGRAHVRIDVNNSSTAASALRPPVLGYTEWWQKNVAPLINRLFRNGGGSPISQHIVLNEDVTLSRSNCPN